MPCRPLFKSISYIEHGVNELCTFSVMSLGPIVTGSSLAKNKVVRSEELTKRARSDAVHGTRFKVHQNGTRHVTAASCLSVIHVEEVGSRS